MPPETQHHALTSEGRQKYRNERHIRRSGTAKALQPVRHGRLTDMQRTRVFLDQNHANQTRFPETSDHTPSLKTNMGGKLAKGRYT